jgi:cytochrome c oxidase cbb3-type subunit 3
MAIKRPDPLLDHDYDGIKENDYPPPGWFNAIFYGSIVFGIAYFLFFHAYGGPTLLQEYQADRKALAEMVKRNAPPRVFTAAELSDAEKNKDVVAAGAALYQAKCATCHLADGGGQVGPNLTDAFWINGDGSMASLLKTIGEGVPDKGMPVWGDTLEQEEILGAAAFVRSLRGTTPANPKAPQGAVPPAEPKAP